MALASSPRAMHLLMALLVALALTGCATATDSDEGGDDVTQDAQPDKFEQTWPKTYDKTKCSEWLNQMDQHENFVAAADMLVGARSVDDEDADLPDDDLIERFRDGITEACVVPSMKLTDVGVGLYLTEKATFKP